MDSSDASRRRRKDARPQELLDAALALFVEKGFAATRAEEVAQRAGVSKGTLYLYFPSKEELLKAVIRTQLSERIAAGASVVAAHTGDVSALMRGPLADWWLTLYRSPASGVFKLMIAEARTFPEIAQMYADEVALPASALLRGMLQAGIDRGEFRPVALDTATHSLLLPLVMACLHRHAFSACGTAPLLDGERFIHQHIDLVLHGLKAEPRTT